MSKTNTDADMQRPWSAVAEDLANLKIFDQYAMQVKQGDLSLRPRFSMVQGDSAEDEEPVSVLDLDYARESESETGLFPPEFWDDLHDLFWKYSAAREKELRREIRAMTYRVELFDEE